MRTFAPKCVYWLTHWSTCEVLRRYVRRESKKRSRVNSNPNPNLTPKLTTRFQSFLGNLILKYQACIRWAKIFWSRNQAMTSSGRKKMAEDASKLRAQITFLSSKFVRIAFILISVNNKCYPSSIVSPQFVFSLNVRCLIFVMTGLKFSKIILLIYSSL